MGYALGIVVLSLMVITATASAEMMTPFEMAIYKNDLPTMKALAAKGEMHYESKPMPLHLAAMADAKDVVDWLIANGADFYARADNGQLALDVPPGEELNATRKRLREINKTRNEFLDAVAKGDVDKVKQQLAADKLLAGARDIGDGWSALMMACHFGHVAVVEALLAAKAPLDVVDFNNGQDAVIVCAEKGQAECLKLILKAGADPKRTATIKYGSLPMQMNALHMAAWKKQPAIVAILIEAGVDVNERAASYAMFSPLHFAATEGDAESVKLLLKAGSDITARDGRRNITALQMAEAGKHDACAAVLRPPSP